MAFYIRIQTEQVDDGMKTPVVAVDMIIEKDDKIVLLLRDKEPFRGMIVVPGGKVEYGETVEEAAIRESKEETGLKVKLKDILGVYSDPKRDPRWHSVSVAFVEEIVSGKLKGSYEGEPKWYSMDEIDFDKMGFDHGKILKDYMKWKKSKGTFWSSK